MHGKEVEIAICTNQQLFTKITFVQPNAAYFPCKNSNLTSSPIDLSIFHCMMVVVDLFFNVNCSKACFEFY